ncbi:ABC transporter ATP-binding protein [Christiangramia salexigens]|nr:ABC transporter ATP-binding protein [Christiangramia salexigens]
MVGLLDGIGLAMFIPLIQLAFGIDSNNKYQDRISNFILENFHLEIDLLSVFLVIVILFSIKAIFKFLESFLRVHYQQIFMRKVRFENIDLLSEFDYQKFVVTEAGKIQNNLSSEVNRLSIAFRLYFKTIQISILVIVYLGLAVFTDWRFTILVVLGGVIMNFVFLIFYKRTKYFSKKFSSESNVFQGLLMQKINNFQYLKATGLNRSFGKQLKSKIFDIEAFQKKLGIVEASLGALREPFAIAIVSISILIYSKFIADDIASIILSLLLLYRCLTYFLAMQEQWNLFLGVSGSLNAVNDFNSMLIKNKDSSGENKFKGLKNSLNLRNVDFGYHNGNPVLKNINLSISKNEILAIVGESGSGKTTLMNIIAGILKPSQGEYLVDNYNFGGIEAESFKRRLGYIVQNPVIFNDTIFNNISCWLPKTSENLDKFWKAAKKASIYNYIQSLPDKENTLLGYNGINISGGQKQRFSIARELFKDSEILFMDEATSNLDSETEFEIHNNIKNLKGEYTIVLIAHRLATVKSADRIVVLNNGHIEDIGTYNYLIENCSEFKRMVNLQML